MCYQTAKSICPELTASGDRFTVISKKSGFAVYLRDDMITDFNAIHGTYYSVTNLTMTQLETLRNHYLGTPNPSSPSGNSGDSGDSSPGDSSGSAGSSGGSSVGGSGSSSGGDSSTPGNVFPSSSDAFGVGVGSSNSTNSTNNLRSAPGVKRLHPVIIALIVLGSITCLSIAAVGIFTQCRKN